MTDPVVWRSLSRPPDGRIMCCICFRYREVADLFVDPVDGRPWDVCGDAPDGVPCAEQAGLPEESGRSA